LAAVFLVANQLWGDVLISESTVGAAGRHRVEGTRITMIKGLKMRVEAKVGKDVVVVLYDAAACQEISLNSRKREARIRKFSELREAAERSVPKERVTSSIAPTGGREDVGGKSCDENAFTIRVPILKDGGPVLVMTGKACVAKDVAGAEEYSAFALAADKEGLVLGFTSSNPVFVALARAETTVYRIVAELGGIPLKLERNIRFEGGFLAALLNRSAGTRSSQVISVSVDSLPPEEFGIPAGWKSVGK
jgi:hypothetical protein